ncbi:MAG: patatin-like phospholipase family protein [Candidatus Obscuribacterales bacterium]|jgi:hypothetical protein|nr:patatin-like phospholipase family protein [Candidatus Obscuribacterales bacterium]
MQKSENKKAIDFVLSGGGPKGAGHAGFLKAVEESKVILGKGTGISIGSIVLALYVNGYRPEEICQIVRLQFERLRDRSGKGRGRLRWPSLKEFLNGELLDMLPVFQDLCAEYKLKPQANMQIVAYDILHHRPKVFAGTDYDLAKALAASSAIPGVMRPVIEGKVKTISSWKQYLEVYERMRDSKSDSEGIYVDGFMHHPFAFDFSSKPALISKLGMGTELPVSRLTQLSVQDLAFHFCELILARTSIISYPMPDPRDALLIETGLPSIASVAWNLPASVHKELFDYGYKSTSKSLRTAKRNKWLRPEHLSA